MKQIEIFAYTMINGDSHYNTKFKHCFVTSLGEVAAFEEKIQRRYERKYKSDCKVHAVYRYNYSEWKGRPH